MDLISLSWSLQDLASLHTSSEEVPPLGCHSPQRPSPLCPSRSGAWHRLYRLPLGGWDGVDRGPPGPLREVSGRVR